MGFSGYSRPSSSICRFFQLRSHFFDSEWIGTRQKVQGIGLGGQRSTPTRPETPGWLQRGLKHRATAEIVASVWEPERY